MKKYLGAGAKVLGVLASLFMAFSFASCDDGGSGGSSPKLKSIVAAESLTLNKGDTFPTTGIVYAYYDNADIGTYSQPGSDAQDVTSKATFTAGSVTFKAGAAISVDSRTYTVTVTFGGKTATITLTVEEPTGIALVSGSTSTSYDTIQEALNSLMNSSATGTYTITLEPGTYNELVYYKGSATVVISGQGTADRGTDVVIAYSNSGNSNKMSSELGVSGGYLRSVARFDGAANIVLENLTIQNTYSRSENDGNNTQAEALLFYSTGHLAAYNCSFKSHQDTIQTEGKAWFYNCYVEGDVDFTWIEHTAEGKVALYENCTLRALGDENASARFAAPRLIGTTANIGKGEVFLNTAFESDSDGKLTAVYLARSVASGTDVDQAAFINCTSTMTNLTAPWEKTPYMLTGVPRTIIGWKMDQASATAFNYTSTLTGDNADILSDADVTKEFSGRRAVLNRVYNTTAAKYKKDYDSYWDVDTLISSRSWTVAEDTSKDLLADETESSVVTYDTSKEISEYSELIADGFAKENGKNHWVGQNGNTLTIPVTGKALVTVVGYYKGNGIIGFEGQGDALYAFNNGSTNATLEKAYVNYTGAGNIVITATATTYITKITVEYDSSLTFTPVTAITLSATDNATSVVGKKTLQLSAALTPSTPTNDDVVWSVSDESVATIDQSGLLTAANVTTESTVTVTCTSKDANAVAGTYDLTVTVAPLDQFSIAWLESEATSTTTGAATSDNALATGSALAASNSPDYGSWGFNSSKLKDSNGGLTFTTTAAIPENNYDVVYIDFPVTAGEKSVAITEVKIAYGNHGTGNPTQKISYSSDSGNSWIVASDEGAAYAAVATSDYPTTRQTTLKTPVYIPIAANSVVTVRVALGNPTGKGTIASGKAPTIGTTIISGEVAPEKGGERTYSMASYYNDKVISASLGTDYYSKVTSEDGFFTLNANSFNGTQHGVVMKDSTFLVKVIPGSVVTMAGCAYSNGGTVTVTSSEDSTLSDTVTIAVGTENNEYSYTYTGSVIAWLTFTYPNPTNYLHYVKVQD